MTAAGFDCPEGTRIVIQRPDGYFTALVRGTVRVNMVIVPGERVGTDAFWTMEPDEVVGASLDLHFDIDWDDDSLYTVALGKYEET